MYFTKLHNAFVQIVKHICPSVHSVDKEDQPDWPLLVIHHITDATLRVWSQTLPQQLSKFGRLK